MPLQSLACLQVGNHTHPRFYSDPSRVIFKEPKDILVTANMKLSTLVISTRNNKETHLKVPVGPWPFLFNVYTSVVKALQSPSRCGTQELVISCYTQDLTKGYELLLKHSGNNRPEDAVGVQIHPVSVLNQYRRHIQEPGCNTDFPVSHCPLFVTGGSLLTRQLFNCWTDQEIFLMLSQNPFLCKHWF